MKFQSRVALAYIKSQSVNVHGYNNENAKPTDASEKVGKTDLILAPYLWER